MPRDLAQVGRRMVISSGRIRFERLCSDDGDTIAADDSAKLTSWQADKVAALEMAFRATGLTEADIIGLACGVP
jgi:hypothetical protein